MRLKLLLLTVAGLLARGELHAQGQYIDTGVTAIGVGGGLITRQNMRGGAASFEFINDRVLALRFAYQATDGKYSQPVTSIGSELLTYVGKNRRTPVFGTLRAGFVHVSPSSTFFTVGGSIHLNRRAGRKFFLQPQVYVTEVIGMGKIDSYTLSGISIGGTLRFHNGSAAYLEVGRRTNSLDRKSLLYIGGGFALAYKFKKYEGT